jgi:tRNA(Ile)-lysidine synthase TilS/MesJ
MELQCRPLFAWYKEEVRQLMHKYENDWVEYYSCPLRQYCGPGSVNADDVVFV